MMMVEPGQRGEDDGIGADAADAAHRGAVADQPGDGEVGGAFHRRRRRCDGMVRAHGIGGGALVVGDVQRRMR